MEEKFLHYIWQYKLFKHKNFIEQTNEAIEIINTGEYNNDAGPDFFNAKIKIGNTLWAGNVEIHVNSSDWYHHKHQDDERYNNIILHVVFNNDKEIFRSNGDIIPTIEISFYKSVYNQYKSLLQNKNVIKCANYIQDINQLHIIHWIDQLAIERLNYKSTYINEILNRNLNNWEETFYQILARAFGFKVNAYPFEQLAINLPNKILGKHKNSLFQIEALLFGQAGFLDESSGDEYYTELSKEFNFLKKKYSLQALNNNLWKFMRMRPVNFPTIRIAQFAQLIYKSSGLFSKLTNCKTNKDFADLFNINVSTYWETHYNFKKSSKKADKKLGNNSFNSLMINAILPLLFVYAKSKDDEKLAQQTLNNLEFLPAEKNSIIANWNKLGITTSNAFQTQAILQLNNEYCKKNNCLKCQIGHRVLTKKLV